MKKQYLIGIDLGSSFSKATIFDTDGRSLGDVKHDNHPDQPRPGVAEYDAPKILNAVLSAIKDLLEKSKVNPSDVAAICMDGMISGAMGIDEKGEATTPYTTVLDMRFAPQLNHVMDNFHDLIREKTGSGQPTIGPKMMWIRDEFPDVYNKTSKFLTITGYVAGKMAGLSAEEAFIDYTYLWATGLSDTPQYAWSDELCKAMDLPVEKLPKIVKSIDIIGKINHEAAKACGLLEGTPIVAGAGDQSAGFVGAGLTRPNQMGDVAGTFPVLALCIDEFRPDLKNKMAEIVPSPIPNLFNPCSIILGGGLTHHWFKENFAYADEVEAQKRGKDSSAYEILDENAGKIAPGSDNLLFNPHLGGRMCPIRTNYKGAWLGFTWTHKREHFYRAALESIAYDQRLAFRSMKQSYPEIDINEVLVYGGGSKSALWNQIKADVMGIPYVALDREDLSALGDAIIAGYALGIYSDIGETAERFVRRVNRFEPDNENHKNYQKYVGFYEKFLDQTDSLFDELAEI